MQIYDIYFYKKISPLRMCLCRVVDRKMNWNEKKMKCRFEWCDWVSVLCVYIALHIISIINKWNEEQNELKTTNEIKRWQQTEQNRNTFRNVFRIGIECDGNLIDESQVDFVVSFLSYIILYLFIFGNFHFSFCVAFLCQSLNLPFSLLLSFCVCFLCQMIRI